MSEHPGPSGALAISVQHTLAGWVAVCQCGYRTESFASQAFLAEHVLATFPAHIIADHLPTDDEEERQ